MKIGRNEKCWCGSGIKYKKCHLERGNEQPPNFNNLLDIEKKTRFKLCLHPNASNQCCSEKIIKAHSIQKTNGLTQIAEKGHVYTTTNTIGQMKKNNGLLSLHLTGINKATTFTGFCNKHDSELFKPIEGRNSFRVCQEHICLISYRILCRELYVKLFQLNICSAQKKLDCGVPVYHQEFIQNSSRIIEMGAMETIKDLEHYKHLYDNALFNNDYSEVNYYVITFKELFPIMCSSAFIPEFSFLGKTLNSGDDFNNYKKVLDQCNFSILPRDNGSAFIFSWLGNQATSKKLVESLLNLPNNKLADYLIQFAFEFFENIVIAPEWYNSLNKGQQNSILTIINSGKKEPHLQDCLSKKKIELFNFIPIEIKTNLI